MNVTLVESDAEIEQVCDVLLQLRSAFSRETLIKQLKAQRRQGFQLAYIESNGEVLCVAGFVLGMKLAWGKHMYIDDLVTAERHRSTGAGAAMIAWLKQHARRSGCSQLHLDSGVQRFGAHKFYLREGFNIGGHHFSITVLGEAEDRG